MHPQQKYSGANCSLILVTVFLLHLYERFFDTCLPGTFFDYSRR